MTCEFLKIIPIVILIVFIFYFLEYSTTEMPPDSEVSRKFNSLVVS